MEWRAHCQYRFNKVRTHDSLAGMLNWRPEGMSVAGKIELTAREMSLSMASRTTAPVRLGFAVVDRSSRLQLSHLI